MKGTGADKLIEKGGFSMELKHLNAQEFDEALQSGKAAMIDFSAVWCGPCQILAPVMETLADRYEGKALVAKVDVDEQRELAIQYRVMSVPTVLFIKDGQVFHQLYRGRNTNEQMYQLISDTLTTLATGGEQA